MQPPTLHTCLRTSTAHIRHTNMDTHTHTRFHLTAHTYVPIAIVVVVAAIPSTPSIGIACVRVHLIVGPLRS